MSHKTKTLPLKVVDIDEKIAPLILWLNSFHSVSTFYCCQGSKKREPYVIFSCNNLDDLQEILRAFRGWHKITCNVDCELESFPFRYSLRFNNTKVLDKFMKSSFGHKPDWRILDRDTFAAVV